MTPAARTLLELRKRGCIAQVVEQTIRASKFGGKPRIFKRDLFGCMDLVALEPGRQGVLGIQATTVSNQAARVKKILDEPRALMWLGCGCRIEVHGWSKRGARGKRKTWTLSVMPITVERWNDPLCPP